MSGEPEHPACVETTGHFDMVKGVRTWMHGQDCPRPAGPDPERDARREIYHDRERRRAARALDRYVESLDYGEEGQPQFGARSIDVAGERFVEAVGDYVVARLTGRWDEVATDPRSHAGGNLPCDPCGGRCTMDEGPALADPHGPVHQKADYGVADPHGPHPHGGARCLDCPICCPPEVSQPAACPDHGGAAGVNELNCPWCGEERQAFYRRLAGE